MSHLYFIREKKGVTFNGNSRLSACEYKGSSKSKQWINRCFNTIHSGKDTVKRWYCFNCTDMWLEFRPRQFRSVSAEPLVATHGTLRFRGTPVEKHF